MYNISKYFIHFLDNLYHAQVSDMQDVKKVPNKEKMPTWKVISATKYI